MASIIDDGNGRKRVSWIIDGKRKQIRLGEISKKDAETIRGKIAAIVKANAFGVAIDSDLIAWLDGISETLHKRMAAVGLIPSRKQESAGPMTLAAFLDAYIKQRGDMKESTAITYGNVRRNLVEHFGGRKILADIHDGDADGFRLYLLTHLKKSRKKRSKGEQADKSPGKKLATNTVNKRCQIAKKIFKAAVRQRLIRSNPFADMRVATVKANRERDHFITAQDAATLIEECPDTQWRLIIALSRFGGLRCPSEHLALRWADINWERGRIVVHSPKTEHRAGGELRIIPIFPELVEPLREAQELYGDKSEFVISRYRDAGQNLRTQFLKIIKRAGLKPWPRLFHNLRASRQTELMQSFPIHVVCEWLGNSKLIAQEHYLRVNEGDFEKATNQTRSLKSGAKSGAPNDENVSQPIPDHLSDNEKTPENAIFSGVSQDRQWSLLDSNQ